MRAVAVWNALSVVVPVVMLLVAVIGLAAGTVKALELADRRRANGTDSHDWGC